jgi:hypothetical protein
VIANLGVIEETVRAAVKRNLGGVPDGDYKLGFRYYAATRCWGRWSPSATT